MTGQPTATGPRDPFAGACAPRAEVFGEGVSFVRGWSSARRAADDLATELGSAGLADYFSGLRADVSVNGDGLVCIGAVTVDAVQRLTDLLVRGLCAELDHSLSDPDRPSAAA